MNSNIEESIKSMGMFVILCAVVIGGVVGYRHYAANRTATVQGVHGISSNNDDCIATAGLSALSLSQSCFELYMNDGTVWMVGRAFPVIAGDRIRYERPNGQIMSFNDYENSRSSICILVNITRNALIAGKRINGPKADSSCPAD